MESIDAQHAESSDGEFRSASRELRSILELSKEARLETNIDRKRKAVEDKPAEETTSSGVKRKSTTVEVGTPTETKRGRRTTADEPDLSLLKANKDPFCWRCHKVGVDLSCETCPRSFHSKCTKTPTPGGHWQCPECIVVLKRESTKTRSPSMRTLDLTRLCNLLKFALRRMMELECEPFLNPVNPREFPDYRKYIVQPMDLRKMERNLQSNLYGSTDAFEADAKWILHNSIIFNSYQSKLTTTAKQILRVCRQEMQEIENCASCYLNANTRKNWFVEVCPKPHLLLWAKLKGFPYWPAKAIKVNNLGMVDVRFFGAHDRAWVSHKDCYLYSQKNPNSNHLKKNDINECVKEVDLYVENVRRTFGVFNYAPFKMPFDPEADNLSVFLPKYSSAENKGGTSPKSRRSSTLNTEQDDDGKNGEAVEKPDQSSREKSTEKPEEKTPDLGTNQSSKMEVEKEQNEGTVQLCKISDKLLKKLMTESSEDKATCDESQNKCEKEKICEKGESENKSRKDEFGNEGVKDGLESRSGKDGFESRSGKDGFESRSGKGESENRSKKCESEARSGKDESKNKIKTDELGNKSKTDELGNKSKTDELGNKSGKDGLENSSGKLEWESRSEKDGSEGTGEKATDVLPSNAGTSELPLPPLVPFNNTRKPPEDDLLEVLYTERIEPETEPQKPPHKDPTKVSVILNRAPAVKPKPKYVAKIVQKPPASNGTVEIKDEPASETEDDMRYMKAKKVLFSALNISEKGQRVEKPRTIEQRTRSKTEERAQKSKVIVVDDVEPPTLLNNLESKMKAALKHVLPKQRARKSFPSSKKEPPKKAATPTTTIATPTSTTQNIVLVPQMVLPQSQGVTYANNILTLRPGAFILPKTTAATAPAKVQATKGDVGTQTEGEDALPKALADALCAAALPKVGPRPPAPLSERFDEGLPDSAGPVNAYVNSLGHRLSDYFRGVLVEAMNELAQTDDPKATVSNLLLEVETLKYRHNEQILEIKKNVNSILHDLQKSFQEEKERALAELRSSCEQDALRRVDEAKSKQWCANCLKEAQFYCCWNTSYCDYPCQSKHWPKHMSKCTQNAQPQNSMPGKTGQSIVLRQALPPKFGGKAILGKTTKVYVSKAGNKVPVNILRTTATGLTLVESRGNYELLSNGGKLLSQSTPTILNKIKPANALLSSPNPAETTSKRPETEVRTTATEPPALSNGAAPQT